MGLRQKYQALSLPIKATIWFTACNFIIKGIGFFTGPIFTRLLPEEEYGVLSVFLSYEQLMLILATWEIHLGAYQKGIFKYKENVDFFTTTTQALSNILTILFFFVIFLFYNVVKKYTEMSFCILLLIFVNLLLCPAYYCWLARKRKAYEYKKAVAVTLLFSVINVLIPMMALLLFERTAVVKFGITLISSSVICSVLYFRHANYWDIPKRWNETKTYWKYCIRFEGPLVLHSLSFLILSQADRVMIKEMVGSSQAAFYSVAYSIASVVTIFQSSINTSLAPWRFQMLEEKKYDSVRVVTTSLVMPFAALILMFILVAPEVIALLFPMTYYEAIWCIPPVSTSVFFMFLYTIFVNIEEYYEKTKYVVIVSVSCGLINIILNYICINAFGYVAAGYTTLISYALFSIGHFYFMKKTLANESIDSKNVVDGRAILIISLSLIVLSVVITLLYEQILLRYLMLIIVATTTFCFRKKIVEIIKTIKTKR